MHWLCDTTSLKQIDPAWPRLPNTAIALLSKGKTDLKLLGAEQVLAQQMNDNRLADFAAGRACAHLAQKHLGLSAQPILRDERAPVWPKGQCGSISHAKDWALAAVSTSLRGIGVDVETQGRVKQKLYRALFRPEEVSAFSSCPDAAPSVAFAAKEAGYKAIYPIGGAYVGFQEASVELDWQSRSFRIRYYGNHKACRALESGVGYWRLFDSYVIVFFAIQD